MDKKKSLINVFTSISFKLIIVVLALLSRRYLIKYLGNDYNGLLALYSSIIGFLAITELGIGSAISFSMYKPIVDGDSTKVAGLYHFYVKIYFVIAAIILVLGISIIPFLPKLASGQQVSNLTGTYTIMLLSIVISYFYSAKMAVINAYKNNYITTIIQSLGLIGEYLLQIIILHIFASFELFLLCKVISSIVQLFITNLYFNKKYKYLNECRQNITKDTKKDIIKKTKAMFGHKVGTLLVNSCDSLIISHFIGVVVLGKYNNYATIIISINSILLLFFTPLSSIIGHFCVSSNNTIKKNYFYFFYGINFTLGMIFYLGFYAVIDETILFLFGENLSLSRDIVFVLSLNYFIQFLRTSTITFRDVTGTFYYDRYKPIVEGLLNLFLSLIMVRFMGVTGVIIATIITNLLICNIIEPYVLFKHVFDTKCTNFYIMNYSCILVFLICLFIVNYAHIQLTNSILTFFVNGSIAILVGIIPCVIMYIFNKPYRIELSNIVKSLYKKFFKSHNYS